MKMPIVFIKAIETVFFDEFLEGNIFMNTFSFFRELECTNTETGDKSEGMLSYFAKDILDCAEITVNGKITNSHIKDISLNQSFGNILCLYSIDKEKDEISEEYLKKFEKCKMCIINPIPFLSRLETKLNENGYTMEHRKVEYFSEDESQLSFQRPFRKRNKYSYQNEYRVMVSNTKNEPIRISIGSLKDIAFEVDFNSFPKDGSLNINFETKQISFHK